jgi:glycosyltransferase involved in cell wall biosynthesis
MLTVAYLANIFPSAVEPYVVDEIEELRKRGVRVIAGSVRRARGEQSVEFAPEIVLQPLHLIVLLRAAVLCWRRSKTIMPLVARVLLRGREGPLLRAKALAHTWLGACYAVRLDGRRVEHIHVHHGYFGSWVGMVAARLLGVRFSMTLHGSDLLLHGAYLDVKLESCTLCATVSEYNRQYIMKRYPWVDPSKIVVTRLGVDVPGCAATRIPAVKPGDSLKLLAVGRLHRVKDHAFLVRACSRLRSRDVPFECDIAGEGPERHHLEALIRKMGLEKQVTLLGHVPRERMNLLYDRADVVVLTSQSEGIPLVLMEAMARGKIVLAPAITGIPELVVADKTGFLYQPGSLDDFVSRLCFIRALMQPGPETPAGCTPTARLDWMRFAAQVQVHHNFNHKKNLESFADIFLQRIAPRTESTPDENFVLQQIQLSFQRDRSLSV